MLARLASGAVRNRVRHRGRDLNLVEDMGHEDVLEVCEATSY